LVCVPRSEPTAGRRRHLGVVRLAVSAFAALTLGLAAAPAGAETSNPTNERVQALVTLAMQAYWTGGDPRSAALLLKGVTLHGRYDVVERAFTEAAALAPSRLDLRFAVASTQILQKNLAGARATYGQILAMDPAAFEAYAWLAALDRTSQDWTAAAGDQQAMAALEPRRAALLAPPFDRAEEVIREPVEPARPEAIQGKVTIVALGYALNPTGGMEKPLLDRLAATLAAARAHPQARIVVTGGQPQAGVTEADLMTRWLVQNGVDRDRVQIEDKAKDTVGNALNTAGLIAQAPAGTVLLVTSASHMRRARLLMEAALEGRRLDTRVIPWVAGEGLPSGAGAPGEEERLAIYRDVLRVSDVWAYPGLQR
jgi:uncharacterized SAM-binding protein YcdF (DUF218 family)